MDALAFRLANRIVGNPPDAAGLELTVAGPTLRFNCRATIALTGADMEATLDGKPVPLWEPMTVPAGATLEFKAVQGPGARAYLAFAAGSTCRTTWAAGHVLRSASSAGTAGRTLRAGRCLAGQSGKPTDTLSAPL